MLYYSYDLIEFFPYQFNPIVRNKLAESGIQTSVHYPPVHKFSIYKDFTTSLQKTEYVADSLITLSMYGNLTLGQVNTITEMLIALL